MRTGPKAKANDPVSQTGSLLVEEERASVSDTRENHSRNSYLKW